MPPFHFPFMYNSNYYNKYRKLNNVYTNDIQSKDNNQSTNSNIQKKENYLNLDIVKSSNSHKDIHEDYFFELFGLKLYFDDIIIIGILFFLYSEGVQDDELFISLILLLLS